MEQKGSTATEASSDTILGEVFQKRFAPNWKKELHSASL
jgi:hypothetical protein